MGPRHYLGAIPKVPLGLWFQFDLQLGLRLGLGSWGLVLAISPPLTFSRTNGGVIFGGAII